MNKPYFYGFCQNLRTFEKGTLKSGENYYTLWKKTITILKGYKTMQVR